MRQLGRSSFRTLWLAARVALVSGAITVVAGAESGDPATAESLFRAGKERLMERDFAHACPLLADSFRSDPATGTLLALAICHHAQGKIGSAWKEYTDVAARSKRESRPDREKIARTKALALEPQLSLLTIALGPDAREIEGLEVKRNGVVVDAATLGKAVAVDGGAQVIEASAPGRDRWRVSVSMAAKRDAKTVTIPQLDDSEPAAIPVATRAHEEDAPKVLTPSAPKVDISPPDSHPSYDAPRRSSALQGAGVATMIAGVAGLGFGTVFTLRAISKNHDSKPLCNDANVCSPDGAQLRWDAHDAGNLATIGFIGGGALAVGGVAMYLLGRPSTALSARTSSGSVEASLTGDARCFGGFVRGTF